VLSDSNDSKCSETDTYSNSDPTGPETAEQRDPMDDEEKVLANRPDANIPALLTRDVLGG
jgi:hypothetical protein